MSGDCTGEGCQHPGHGGFEPNFTANLKKMSIVLPVSVEDLIDAGHDVPGYRPTNVRLTWSRWRRFKWSVMAKWDGARYCVGCWIAGIDDEDYR